MHRTPGKEGMMTHQALRSTLDYHRSLPVFAARPLTSGAVAVLSKWTEIDETRVLALLNPLLMAISACLIYALALSWGADPKGAWIATALYLFSFTNLFAFVPPDLYLRRTPAGCYDVGGLLVSPTSRRVGAECWGIARGAIL